jgi:hypothetical protein
VQQKPFLFNDSTCRSVEHGLNRHWRGRLKNASEGLTAVEEAVVEKETKDLVVSVGLLLREQKRR